MGKLFESETIKTLCEIQLDISFIFELMKLTIFISACFALITENDTERESFNQPSQQEHRKAKSDQPVQGAVHHF